jgi:epoxyqueuosine reductase
LGRFKAFSQAAEIYPWAKSAVVAIYPYGIYKLPPNLLGRVGRSFCVDSRRDADCEEYKASESLEQYLLSLGLRAETERRYGLLPMRWVAYKAGLGIGRRNNFFYTQNGSFVHLEAWLIDQELDLPEKSDLKPCPPDCQKCLEACPTKALTKAYLTRPGVCLTFLNSVRENSWIDSPYSQAAGDWIFGCDMCQIACPFNKGRWQEKEDFPGLFELSQHMNPGQILEADYGFIRERLMPKFWYITEDRLWQWKINVLNAMKNSWVPEYSPYVNLAKRDEMPQVRQMADWVSGIVAN